MAAVTAHSDFGAQEDKICHCFIFSPSICHEVREQMPWSQLFVCWVLSLLFLYPVSPSSRGSLVSLCFLPLGWYHQHNWGYWYFSSKWCFIQSVISHDAQKLNKQGDSIQPCHIPFPILNQSALPCPDLTVASWPTYRFIRRQVR